MTKSHLICLVAGATAVSALIAGLAHKEAASLDSAIAADAGPLPSVESEPMAEQMAASNGLQAVQQQLATLDQTSRGQALILEQLGVAVSRLAQSVADQSAIASPEAVQNLPEDANAADAAVHNEGDGFTEEAAELAREEQRLLSLDGTIAEEPYDHEWAPQMQDKLQVALEQERFSGSQLSELTCQSSLCRIEVEHATGDAEDEFLHQFLGEVGFSRTEAYYWREAGDDGSVQMTYYVSRDGHRLPDLGLTN